MFRWIEHAGALELELESESEDGVFIDAVEALRELLEEDTGAGLGDSAEYEVDATGADRGALLANLLGEVSDEGLLYEPADDLHRVHARVTVAVQDTAGA
jgi:hypothetical protein